MTNRYGGYNTHSFIAEYYDATYNPGPVNDIPFFVKSAQQAGGPVLELGCGTGRVLIPTARAGCTVTGLDISPYMLNKCREKLNAEAPEVQQQVKLTEGDMTNFNIGQKYSMVTIPSRSFHLLINVEDQLACLHCIHQHLKPHGRVIIDFFSPNPTPVPDVDKPPEPPKPAEILMADGRKIVRANRVARHHPEEQYNDIEILYIITFPDGHMENPVQSFSFRSFYRYEVEHLLSIGGFKVIDLYGSFDKSPFTSDSQEMIFVASKK